MTLDQVVAILAQMAGVAAFGVVLINILKRFGVVKDGSAGLATKVYNFAAFALIWALATFAPDFDLWIIDDIANAFASIGGLVLVLIPVSSKFGAWLYGGIKGVPVVGYSHSA